MARTASFSIVVCSVGLLACSASPGDTPDADPTADGGRAGAVTYHGDVRPILAEQCVSCHVAGGIGPFPLDTYESAASMASRIAQATRDRIMPPYLADNSGDCQSFRDARWLTDDEIELLTMWDEQGEPLGDPAIPAPVAPSLPTLDGALTTIDIGVSYEPDRGSSDDYRCFIVEAPFDTEYYLTGHHVHPGNQAIVHHVITYAPYDAAAVTEVRRRDEAEAGPGYTCFGAPGVDAFPVVLWAPGGAATNYPSGTGVRLTGGWPLIVQIHYNVLAGSGNDRTTIDLETAPDVARAARIVPVADFDLRLPARMSSTSTTDTWTLSTFTSGMALPVTIYGVFPHMHTLGRTIRVDHIANSDGDEQCMVDVPRWDFNWQREYHLASSTAFAPGDRLSLRCEHANPGRQLKTWGENSSDEMCIAFLYVSEP